MTFSLFYKTCSTIAFQLGFWPESQVSTSKCLLDPPADVCRHLLSQHVPNTAFICFPQSPKAGLPCVYLSELMVPSFTQSPQPETVDNLGSSLPPESPTSNSSLSLIQSPSYPPRVLLASASSLLPGSWAGTSFSLPWTMVTVSQLIFLHSESSLSNPFSTLSDDSS